LVKAFGISPVICGSTSRQNKRYGCHSAAAILPDPTVHLWKTLDVLMRHKVEWSIMGRLEMKQVAALPYDLGPDGGLKVMLITSRRTCRWVIPKGNPIKGIKAHKAAALEAFEEAGLIGIMTNRAVGKFRYIKQKNNLTQADVEVTVFPMLVTKQVDDWPERRQRERRWLDLFAAAQLADDPGLKRLILAFDPHRSD
jgi:8-oxo-dGTP pyrophosphatase MutT (NUDIX family)